MCNMHTNRIMNDGPLDIKALREKLGWTQEQMAEYLGLDRSSVSRMESGQEPKGPARKLLEELKRRAPAKSVEPVVGPAS